MEYKEYELGELIEYRNEKLLIENVSLENYISTENLLPNRNGKQNAEKLPNTKSVKKYYENDILISNIRPYFKKIWQAEIPGGASNDVLILNSCSNNTTNDYLYYYLSQDKFFDYMTQTAKGTKMPRGDKKAILGYEIKVPNIKHIQNYIVNLGKNIDKKIETNKKIIANLEELSQTLFKRWFVDFEFPDENGNPYKSSGGEMVDSELGKIPKGWEIVNLNDISLKISKGTTPKKDINTESSSQNIPFLKVKDLSDFYDIKMENVQYISKNTHENLLKRSKLQPQDILLSIAGTIGRIAYVPTTLKNVNINQAIGFIRLKNNNYFLYIYNYLKQNDFQNYLTKSVVQAVQANISLKVIKEYKVLIPVNNLINDWDSHIQSLHDKIGIKKNEINQLTQLRDTLLPKLMSGEIEIPDDIEVNEDELSI
ncbi:restriction endonuclease subunit S [Staphylococcus pseudintermedius]|nr:restriction endonuclease subunit S [Staphylococcus pseudintermedius]